MPDTAASFCDGLAYLIVGAEAGQVHGTPGIDGADLDQEASRYLGADGPTWAPMDVTVEGNNVLVVVVEPPRWGDRMHTLRTRIPARRWEGGRSTSVARLERSRPTPRTSGQLEDRLMRGLKRLNWTV